jgi:transposase
MKAKETERHSSPPERAPAAPDALPLRGEARRHHAWTLYQNGWTEEAIAAELGTTQPQVSKWIRLALVAGPEALGSRARGRPSQLSDVQREQLAEQLRMGARAVGHADDQWTQTRVASLIHSLFGIRYSLKHAGKLMRALGYPPAGRFRGRPRGEPGSSAM